VLVLERICCFNTSAIRCFDRKGFYLEAEMDLIYLGVTVAFFVLTWGLLKLCGALMEGES
jgi:hypothetical protein